MRRPRFRRSSSRFSITEYTLHIPPSPTQMSLRRRDTGFPEPFCGSRNTSLPHPEANLSPDACITEDDVNPARALLRHRMTFMARQELRNGSSGSHYRNVSTSSSSENGGLTGELPTPDALMSPKDADSIESSSDRTSSRDPDSPPQHGSEFGHRRVESRDSLGSPGGRRRSGSLLSRLIHKHR
ncbi:83f7b988-4477-469b-a237-9940947ac506 [Thermothielavioides terrestris]|uniref:Uncharacterized protein n=2 Tax=Thermothielavioides terrestris TaxID=2587410 RepID=G2QRM9_THETT|nr:uncharacterized protein THITE_2125897 [Thermothielavioides terrestris NRRL 8126]AEO63376.1 hypothetical protein THITE_2125897 [Thermothielavioides terrestris NRRL 8126]SPQ21127.1 83f7b988-4477-469b-a237-9940947ac506 [Thermothielavioides terrestris]